MPITPYNVFLESDVMVPMRDGVRLATDIYFPAGADGLQLEGKWPTLLVRTSYDKSAIEWDGVPVQYVEKGYVFVLQDLRSRYKSEGDARYYHTCNPWDGDDGYDAVEWIAAQPWSDECVGMMGSSHRSIVQTQAALHRPPHLVTICPEQGPTNIYLHEAREGGAMALDMYTAIYNHAFDAHEVTADEETIQTLADGLINARSWIQDMPFKRGEIPLSVAPHLEETLFNYYYRGDYDEWWAQECNDQTHYWDRHSDIPCLITAGWFDPFIDGSTGYFEAMIARNNKPSRLLIGPWGHGTMRVKTSTLGDVEFGTDAMWGYPKHSEIRLRWFDHWLRDINNDVENDSPVEIFVMGGGSGRKTTNGHLDHGGQWRNESEWPLARTKHQKLFLTSELGLTEKKPQSDKNSITFVYDPDNPVPSAGGGLAHLTEVVPPPGGFTKVPSFGTRSAFYARYGQHIVKWGPVDQVETEWMLGVNPPYHPLDKRPDVLVFQTGLLDEDTELTGQVTGKLWISSTAIDTDFTAKLIDVYPPNESYPDGYRMNLSDTILRCRYRNSWSEPEMMVPGQIYPITIILHATSNLFKTGHRIRLDISSSNFPRLDVNPNTGEPMGRHTHKVKAHNTVHLDSTRPSHLILPIIPRESEK